MISTKKIKEINFSDQIYFIPSYQRGYRWENKQVIELLEGFMAFVQFLRQVHSQRHHFWPHTRAEIVAHMTRSS